jgi:hypothetical protein
MISDIKMSHKRMLGLQLIGQFKLIIPQDRIPIIAGIIKLASVDNS